MQRNIKKQGSEQAKEDNFPQVRDLWNFLKKAGMNTNSLDKLKGE